jgi:hypothetical protein
MMPRWLGAIVLLGFGAGLLGVAWNGYRDGTLPAGAFGPFRAWRVNRAENPAAFGLFLVLYFCAGLALCVGGLLESLGMAPALRLR